MKKLIIFFLVLSFSLSILVSFDAYDQKERKQMYLLEQEIGSAFFMPDGTGLSDPNEIYPILVRSSAEMNINLMRPAINNKPNQQMELVKYILLNGPTTLFDHITLKSGEYLSPEHTKSNTAYLSTSQDHSAHQIGIIQDFAGNDSLSVRPLKVKLIDGDTKTTYTSMKSSLKQLKLDDNLHYLITVDQYIADKLYHSKAQLYTASLSLVISMFILILLLLQNVSIVFSKYQQKFIIRGMFGFSAPRKYKEFFVLFIVTWTISLLGVIFTERAYLARAILICFSLLALELWGSLIWLKRIWRKHIIQVIKGGGQ